MRDYRLLKLFYLISIRLGLLLAIVASQLGNEYVGLLGVQTPVGRLGACCGKMPGRTNSYLLDWNSVSSGPTFRCWLRRRSDLWRSAHAEQRTIDDVRSRRTQNGTTEYQSLPGVHYYHSQDNKYVFIAHGWVIGLFAVLTAIPFAKRFIRRRWSSQTKETSS